LKETLFIVIFGVLVYLGFATILGDSALMGNFGAVFATYNKEYFGYLAYIYIFVLLVPLYFLYKDTTFNMRRF